MNRAASTVTISLMSGSLRVTDTDSRVPEPSRSENSSERTTRGLGQTQCPPRK
jgi:hypothetical protein